jgi:hypothetical protein
MGWSREMRDEINQFPETASNIRRASENLERVSAELVEVSAMLSQLVRVMEATGVLDGLARVEKAGGDIEAIRRLLTPPRDLAGAVGKVGEVERMVSGLSDRMLKSIGLKRTDPVPVDVDLDEADAAGDLHDDGVGGETGA